MKISNVRLGHANNSSSTHSIVFTEGLRDRDVEAREFGWDRFVAASKPARLDYLAITLFNNLRQMTSKEQAKAVIQQWLGIEVGEDWYIDHQSVYSLPRNWDGNGLDLQFFNEFKKYLLQRGLVIVGGNDNSDDETDGFMLDIPQDESNKQYVARKDKDYWMIFNKDTGAKIRFSFTGAVPTKASAPELVDLKVTDGCTEGCQFCYMGSTPDGLHAGGENISKILGALRELRVPEIALGGGEPTSHPNFFSGILGNVRSYGIVPNFTTRSLDWLSQPQKLRSVIKNCRSFAYSARDADEVETLAAALKYNGIINSEYCNEYREHISVSIQLVMGTIDRWNFRYLLEAANKCGFRVTLLGWKPSKKEYKPVNYDWWYDSVSEMLEKKTCPTLGIDTELAAKYKDKMVSIPPWMYEIREGAFSCYIDAVKGTIGPSSYCDESKMVKLDFDYRANLAEQIKNVFQSF